MLNRHDINILELSDETGALLEALLKRRRVDGLLLKKNRVYYHGLRRIVLSHDILVREKIPNVWRYDVIDDASIGTGKFGSAHKIIAVLKHFPQRLHRPGLFAEAKQRRVYKIQNTEAMAEYRLMRRCPHLHTRSIYSEIPSYISMREFPGMLLNDALNNERKNNPFTHAQRYRITIGLLRALKKQIHDNMICHRDIKPDNIFYDEKTGEINIFDLGISQLIGCTLDQRSRGNAVFSAPEEFISVRTGRRVSIDEFRIKAAMRNESDVKSDIYSMARVIGLVWRDADPSFYIKQADHAKLMKRRIVKDWKVKPRLFNDINGMEADEKVLIAEQLRRMTRVNKEERPALDECIRHFDRLYLIYKLKRVPQELHDVMMASHQIALDLQAALDDIETCEHLYRRLRIACDRYKLQHDMPVSALSGILHHKFNATIKTLGLELDLYCDKNGMDKELTIAELFSQMHMDSRLDRMIFVITNAIEGLPDHAQAVAEFVETLDCKCLVGIVNKQELLAKVRDIQHAFKQVMNEIIHLHDVASNREVVLDIDIFMSAIYAERLNLDSIHSAMMKMINKRNKLVADEVVEARVNVVNMG